MNANQHEKKYLLLLEDCKIQPTFKTIKSLKETHLLKVNSSMAQLRIHSMLKAMQRNQQDLVPRSKGNPFSGEKQSNAKNESKIEDSTATPKLVLMCFQQGDAVQLTTAAYIASSSSKICLKLGRCWGSSSKHLCPSCRSCGGADSGNSNTLPSTVV